MPLHGQEPHALAKPPADLKPKEEVFVVRQTGEIFRNYEDYLARVKLYRAKRWTSEATGLGGLTYDRAVREEQQARKAQEKFPSQHVEAAIRAVHGSEDDLQNVVWQLTESLGSAAEGDGLAESVVREFIEAVAVRDGGAWNAKPMFRTEFELQEVRPSQPEKVKVAPAAKRATAVRPPTPANGSVKPESEASTRTLEEEEKRFKPQTIKHAIFTVLRPWGGLGLSTELICQQIQDGQLYEKWNQNTRSQVLSALSGDAAFVRLRKAHYALAALADADPDPAVQPMNGERAGSEQSSAAAAAVAAAAKEDAVKRTQTAISRAAEAKMRCQEVLEQAVERLALARQRLQALEKQQQEALSPQKSAPSPGKNGAMAAAEAGAQSKDPAAHDAAWPEELRLPARLQTYGGPDGDRRALMGWKKERADACRELQDRRTEWQQEQRRLKSLVRAHGRKEVEEQQRCVQQAELQVAGAENALRAAERGETDAGRALEKELSRAAEQAERERRKQEALMAKRYPIDDLELQRKLAEKAAEEGAEPPEADLPIPWTDALSEADSQQLRSCLFIADFLSSFSRQLDVKPVSLPELEALLQSASGRSSPPPEAAAAEGASGLGALYMTLLSCVLLQLEREDAANRQERRWRAVLAPGLWPEVLRRYVIARSEQDGSCSLMTSEVVEAAGMLGWLGPELLPRPQHVALLRMLCDELLDTQLLRDDLDKRSRKAEEAARDSRADVAEERRKIREIQEQVKEERKRKREEALARHGALTKPELSADVKGAEGDAAPSAVGNENEPVNSEGEGAVPPSKKMKAATPEAQAPAAADAMDLDEDNPPDLELPEELREYRGDPGDRKMLLAFRQRQQAARKRLEARRAKWQEAVKQKQKLQEQAARAAADAKRKQEKARAEAEDAISTAQEALERELEKHAVRRLPLGADRQHRRYFWGLACCRAVLYIEADATSGRILPLRDPARLQTLLAALDTRGVRERELKEAVAKKQDAIAAAMKRAATAGEAKPASARAAGGERDREVPLRIMPSRRGKPVNLAEGEKRASSDGSGKAQGRKARPGEPQGAKSAPASKLAVSVDQVLELQGVEALAARSLAESVEQLLEAARSSAGVALKPKGGWSTWQACLADLAAGQLPQAEPDQLGGGSGDAPPGLPETPAGSEPLADAVRTHFKRLLLGLEQLLFTATDRQRLESSSSGEEDDCGSGSGKEGADGEAELEEEPEAEECLASPTKRQRHRRQREAADDTVHEWVEEGDEEEADSDGERGSSRHVWLSMKERSVWQQDAACAPGFSCLAYCAAAYGCWALPVLRAARPKKKPVRA